MYTINDVLPVLERRVGWKSTNSPHVLIPENTHSESGRYFQDSHAAITLRRILETMEMSDVETYDITDQQFNEHLIEVRKAAILYVIDSVFTQPEVVEQSLIWTSANTDRSINDSDSDYVGYQIRTARDLDKHTSIDSMSLLFAEDCTIDLELYHSTAGVLWHRSFDCIANRESVFLIDDLVINFTDQRFKSGEFFFRYNPAGIRWINPTFIRWNTTHNIGVEPFFIKNDHITPSRANTFGLNFRYSTVKSFTETIIYNVGVFDRAIMLAVAIRIIEQYIYSDRSNRTERISRDLRDSLVNDLNLSIATDSSPYSVGLRKLLSDEINFLKKNFFTNDKIIKVSPYVGSKNTISWGGSSYR